jgi:hypothetical protein
MSLDWTYSPVSIYLLLDEECDIALAKCNISFKSLNSTDQDRTSPKIRTSGVFE